MKNQTTTMIARPRKETQGKVHLRTWRQPHRLYRQPQLGQYSSDRTLRDPALRRSSHPTRNPEGYVYDLKLRDIYSFNSRPGRIPATWVPTHPSSIYPLQPMKGKLPVRLSGSGCRGERKYGRLLATERGKFSSRYDIRSAAFFADQAKIPTYRWPIYSLLVRYSE